MTRQSRASLRARTGQGLVGGARRKVGQLVRRLRISASSGALWVLSGATDFDGNIESERAEEFGGIGFASRPAAGDNAEAIVCKVGGESGHPVIVATRNRDAFKVLEAGEGLAAGETAIYTGESMVLIKADGSIELGSIGGTRQALATKADIDALAAMVSTHIHVTTATVGSSATPGVLSPPSPGAPAAVCTTKVRGE